MRMPAIGKKPLAGTMLFWTSADCMKSRKSLMAPLAGPRVYMCSYDQIGYAPVAILSLLAATPATLKQIRLSRKYDRAR